MSGGFSTFGISLSDQSVLTLLRTEEAFCGNFSADGSLLSLVKVNGVEVVETSGFHSALTIQRPGVKILNTAFSADGKTLAIAERSSANAQEQQFEISLWDVESGSKKISLPSITDHWYRNVSDIVFSPDGARLASNLGGIPRLWKTSDGSEAKRFGVTETEFIIERTLLSPNGLLFAIFLRNRLPFGEDRVRIFEVDSGKHLDILSSLYRNWVFSSDSNLLVLTAIRDKAKAGEHSSVEIWDVRAAKLVKVIEVPREWRGAYAVSLSPDSSILAIGGYEKFGLFSRNTGKLLASASHPKKRLFKDNEIGSEVSDLRLSPSGKLLISCGNDGRVKVWQIKDQH